MFHSKKVERATRQTGELSTGYDVQLGGVGKLYGVVFVPTTCPHGTRRDFLLIFPFSSDGILIFNYFCNSLQPMRIQLLWGVTLMPAKCQRWKILCLPRWGT